MKYLKFALLLLAFVSLTGCTDGGIKVGPFPVALAIGDGVLDPETLNATPGEFGVHIAAIPLCNLPTREEIGETVKETADTGLLPEFELTELLLNEFVLTANSGSFAGITSVSAFYFASGEVPESALEFASGVYLGTSADIKGHATEIVLAPPSSVDLLNLIDAVKEDSCPAIGFVVTGITPSEPIAWQGDLFADAYGTIDFGF